MRGNGIEIRGLDKGIGDNANFHMEGLVRYSDYYVDDERTTPLLACT
jgi:hypothetical protein